MAAVQLHGTHDMALRLSGRTLRPVSGLTNQDVMSLENDAFPCTWHSGFQSFLRSGIAVRLPLRGQLRTRRSRAAPDSRFNHRHYGRRSPQAGAMVAEGWVWGVTCGKSGWHGGVCLASQKVGGAWLTRPLGLMAVLCTRAALLRTPFPVGAHPVRDSVPRRFPFLVIPAQAGGLSVDLRMWGHSQRAASIKPRVLSPGLRRQDER